MHIYTAQNQSIFEIKEFVEKEIERLDNIKNLYENFSDDMSQLFFNEVSIHEFSLLQNRLMTYIKNDKITYFIFNKS